MLKVEPWSVSHGAKGSTWDAIAATVSTLHGTVLTGEACSRRFDRLHEAFLASELTALRSSGMPYFILHRIHIK